MKLEELKRSVWSSEKKEFLGRTAESWAKLVAFYITLYSCLAAIWSLYFYIFHLTISDKYPKWQLDESLIGSNPGLGVRPQSPAHKVESALISYKSGTDGDYKHWVKDLQDYLDSNNNSTKLNSNCNSEQDAATDTDSFCPFDNSSIPPECSAAQNFSFPLGKPCLLIKINRIYGWKPKPYDSKPMGYPDSAPFTPGNIQITCEGQHDPDKEHIGPVEYYPKGGIETKYYPFVNQPAYQSPYVMAHFKNPKLNTLIYVECRAWAENVEHDRFNKMGMTTFELFIERPESNDTKV